MKEADLAVYDRITDTMLKAIPPEPHDDTELKHNYTVGTAWEIVSNIFLYFLYLYRVV
jgi:hypothetical protein